jgi:alkaline phosphatase D
MTHRIKLLLLLLFAVNQAFSQNMPKVVSGPMNGYAEHSECLVWIQTEACEKVKIEYRKKGNKDWLSEEQNLAFSKKPSITKFILTELEFGSTYEYKIILNGNSEYKPGYNLEFKTKKMWEWRTPPPDFTFLFGSCLYVNDSTYDRPGKPYGQGTEILKFMGATPADFMLWLGDNTYTREADYSSESGFKNRYLHTRKDPNLQEFLSKTHHYAMWDDHDYGENDASSSYDLKDVSRKTFIDYWGNKTYGQNQQGIYSSFRFSDAEFFLLDDRTFRDESDLDENKIKKTQLGKEQITWLKNKLKHSAASFKFVCVGGQFLNANTDKESYNLFKKEREEILQFIVDQNIGGVIFLSGDRHHTEILKEEKFKEKLGYTFYDITSSPLSAGPSNILKSEEAKNPQRVANTLVVENNYCSIKISGPKKGERVLLITCYDKKGVVKWGHQIKESEIKTLKK